MVSQTPLLLQLLTLIDEVSLAPSAARRGHPCQYSERLFLKAVVVMVIRHLPKIYALVAVLDQPEMAPVQAALSEHGALPTRRTFERRLKALVSSLPEQIALVGNALLEQLDPWAAGGRAAAIDSTVLRVRRRLAQKVSPARGGSPRACEFSKKRLVSTLGWAPRSQTLSG